MGSGFIHSSLVRHSQHVTSLALCPGGDAPRA
jgi:hypothetical protein